MTFELPIVAGKLALERQHLDLDAFGVDQHRRAFIRQHEAVAGALEKPLADSLFQRF